MKIGDFEDLTWLDPWEQTSPGLEHELVREVGPERPLDQVKAVAVGRRVDSDDGLFVLPNHLPPLAVVHLTWIEGRESSPHWPSVTFYSSLDDWAERCMKAEHAEWVNYQ